MTAICRCAGAIVCCAVAIPVAAQELAPPEGATPSSAFEQVVQLPPDAPAPTPEHTGIKATFKGLFEDVKNLPSMQNLFLLGAGAAGALAVHPADNHVNEELSDASWSHRVFAPGAVLGQSYALLGASVAVYAVGRVKGERKVSHTGMDMLRSLAISEMMVQTLKYTVRRERPDGSGANGFPSGHSADTFAIATALERHFGWRYAVPAYAFASYVAASRLHDNVHFTSDVVFGAAVGIIAGRTVTRHGRDQFPIAVVAVPGGGAVLYTRQQR
jgi:acid phosphatase family membrane protein YuiD